ncbi:MULTISPECIES: outer membrane lipid asymmetry maintenance protein MlaD [Methylotuvimicrobium]|uniref:ABC transporter n=2 Tax=Methylotuvimicrobium TaxID=2822410 RepID=G4T0Q5_META2|nr:MULTISPECIES: outer membrane lipid asymmetry maintenance protein MlaD [Methylotuvimicrobium]MBE0434914.1 outer membrane lipid asymmetry maintenance protein MlaD [Methylomicrobium sp.]PKM35766.1 MAG: outer membrane lipid asymmetry maintenance protein MlaD [Gammaproteobacteria bacterium HGW-Gammaproteobacteria-10]HBA67002.1 outer membrane lipid asymmetry maintenance protein MlaD [Methylococcaceae bacterium]QCW81357.1 outer membrane lipid asymmetry maintenance protein MlaD [Methylotuvimicrobium
MQHTRTQDTLVGLFVAAGIVALFFLSLQVSNIRSFMPADTYVITARFSNSGGLKVKSPVSVAGVRIGRVSNIYIDKETYESVVEMSIESKYDTLPDDTSATIYTAGLLGEQYINLDPGGSFDYLKNGGRIEITQSAIVLEEVIGRFLFQKAEE